MLEISSSPFLVLFQVKCICLSFFDFFETSYVKYIQYIEKTIPCLLTKSIVLAKNLKIKTFINV